MDSVEMIERGASHRNGDGHGQHDRVRGKTEGTVTGIDEMTGLAAWQR